MMDARGESDSTAVTRLLRELESGDRTAFDRLLPLVYEELRGMAGRQLARESVGLHAAGDDRR